MPRSVRILAAVTALTVVFVIVLAACGEDKTTKALSGYQLTPPPAVGTLSLPEASANDTAFHFTAATGHFLIVYFGYTQCPDVCPTTLNEVRIARKHLATLGDNVDLAMITIDPKRDTGSLLTNYVRSFVSGAHALRTADDTTLQAVAKAFGATYQVATDAQGNEKVTHSGNLYVVDPAGNVVLEWPFGLKADAIATDLEILLGQA
jgi:protein SCO1/2